MKKMSTVTFKSIFLGLSLLASATLSAQVRQLDPSNVREGESVEYCRQHTHMEELLANPAARASFMQDQQIQQQVEQQLLSNQDEQTRGTVYKIPVVFHILHNGGAENLSREQILDALFIMNRDFRRQNADANNVRAEFQGLPADVEIEFVMATRAPNGACFSGITRTRSAMTSQGEDGGSQVQAIIAGNDVYNDVWPGNKYLNIFVCEDIGGAAGYTMLPSNWVGSVMQNGIWVLSTYVGSIGTSSLNTSRTLTHEVGHWLNLDHVWGGTNNPGVSCGSDDVDDTPETIGATSCNLNQAVCGPLANVENYMDYSYCSKMFTPGQKARMRAALLSTVGGRNNISSVANLVATGTDGSAHMCKADFSSNKRVVCVGGQIQFTDLSYNSASGWNWSFAGGTPATSTEQNPLITYTTPGTYEVQLTSTDGTITDGEVKQIYITVLPPSTGLPFYEGFESYSQLSDAATFMASNLDNTANFVLATNVGHSGTKSVKLDNFSQNGSNVDELYSSKIDLSGVTTTPGVTLSFRYAYRKRAIANSESLLISISANCGETWQQRKSIIGSTLSPTAVTTSWTPTSEDWTTVHMTNITSQFWTENFRFKFRFEGNGGNNIYLDDINIYPGAPSNDIVPGTAGLNENTAVSDLVVYPNPTEGELNVRFGVESATDMNFVMTDLMGKTIHTQFVQAATGSNLVMLSTEGLAAGMYLLQVKAATGMQVIEFMVK